MKIILLLITFISLNFLSYSQPDFSRSDHDGVHEVFILDHTASMHGCCPGTKDIWSETVENICEIINNLQTKNCIISFYLFAEDIKVLKINGSDILQLALTDDLKNAITQKLRAIESDGKKTFIKPAFKKVIQDLLANDNLVINDNYQNIYLYTDGIDESSMSCNEAFLEWCNLKRDNDYAAIVSLNDDGIPSSLLSCIPNDCIETTTEPNAKLVWKIRPKTNIAFDFQENKPVKQSWKSQVDDQHLKNKDVNIKIMKGPSLEGYGDVDCYFVDDTGEKVTQFSSLNHELKLYVDKLNLNGGKTGIYKGSFTYYRMIYDDDNQKIQIQAPNLEFTYDQNEVFIGTLNLAK